jgi:hypothetical protein
MKHLLFAAALLSCAFSLPAHAEPLTIDAVIALTTAGLGDEAIIAKLRSANSPFSLTADQMIALKNRGISGAVIAAMINPGAPVFAPMSPDSPDPALPHPTGIYWLDHGGPSARMDRLDPTASVKIKTRNILGNILTEGISRLKIQAQVPGMTAALRTADRRPAFYFFFDAANPDAGWVLTLWPTGTVVTIASPDEFVLARLTPNAGHRELQLDSVGFASSNLGVPPAAAVDFVSEQVRPGVFRVTPSADLPAGEYGFVYAQQADDGTLSTRIFDFSIE